MALLFMDSFDHYATADLMQKWTSQIINSSGAITISPGNGRRASASLRVVTLGYNGTRISLAPGVISSGTGPNSGALLVLGFALRIDALTSSGYLALVKITDGATTQLTFSLQADGLIKVNRGSGGGPLLGVTSSAFPTGVFVSVEIKALIDPANGSVEMRLNGQSVLSVGGVSTSESAAARWSSLILGNSENNGSTGAVNTLDFDDLYVLDGSGTAPWNSFIGDCRVDARFPTGPGLSSDWAPSAGVNWQNVDDAAPNGDTDYNTGAAASLVDTFVVQDAPVPGAAIYGVQHNLAVRKLDAGVCGVAAVVRQGSPIQDYVSVDVPVSTAYTNARVVQQTNPATTAPWTEAAFNASEFGYKKTA
jgi:hypothetical protein